MTDKIVVLVSCASLMEATAIARALLDKKLVACASVGTHSLSFYAWKGQREETTEYPLTLKTSLERFAAVEAEVRRLHAHENPEILALPVLTGSAAYLEWVDEAVRREAG